MNKINLKDVTLVCADDVDTMESYKLLTEICQNITFGDVKLFSSNKINSNITEIDPLKDIDGYGNFIFNLNKYIDTSFCMIVQIDGFPINYRAWTDNFLKYDYIGAPWLVYNEIPEDKVVGNSGFCIRSKNLLEKLTEYDYSSKRDGPEDAYVCRKIDGELKADGIEFAPVHHAKLFSVENMLYQGQFGFHGRGTILMNAAMPEGFAIGWKQLATQLSDRERK
jgi:hypothetical protein